MIYASKGLGRFRRAQDGAAMVEYAIILVVLLTVGTSIVFALGSSVHAHFESADECLTSPC